MAKSSLPVGYRSYKEDEHRTRTTEDLHALKQLITHFRSALKKERATDKAAADIRFEITKFTALKGELPERTKILFSYGPHIRAYYGALPRLINYSCLLQIYTVFEERGRALCHELKRRNKRIKISIDEIRRQADYESIRLFLEKIAGIKYDHWADLELLSKLRHRIVHNNGTTGDVKLIVRINSTKGLMLSDRGHILVGDEYLDKILARVTLLFETVFAKKRFGDASVFEPFDDTDEVEIVTEKVNGKTAVTIYPWDVSAAKNKR